MQIHGPSGSGDAASITAHLNEGDPNRVFAVVEFPVGVSVFLYDEAEADALIKAACAAKDMLAAHKHAAAMAPLPDRGRYDAASAAEVAQCAAPGPHEGVACTRQPGHDGHHYTVTKDGGVEWPAALNMERAYVNTGLNKAAEVPSE